MTATPSEVSRDELPPSLAWYCLRSQPKHEHIAAAHLSRDLAVEVFLPRIRFKRATRRGAVWVTEALFPNYLFARFDLADSLRKVCHGRGVRGVVHFGTRWPTVPDPVVESLRTALGGDNLHLIPDEFAPGDSVRITGGVFHGLEAVVTRAMPGKERVAVLLEFLGRQASVEVDRSRLVPAQDRRQRIF